MGELLKEMPKHKGGRPKTGDNVSPVSEPTLEELGVHKKDSERCQTIADIPDADFEAYIAEARTEQGELTTATGSGDPCRL